MDQSLDVILFQERLQLISFFTENGKLMIDIILVCNALRKGYQRILDVLSLKVESYNNKKTKPIFLTQRHNNLIAKALDTLQF